MQGEKPPAELQQRQARNFVFANLRRPHRIPHIALEVVAARAPDPAHMRVTTQRMPAAKLAYVAGFEERKEITDVAVLSRELEPAELDTC